ncbi:hypothetical protein [Thiocystis minor]|uniref:hypothetical protein n=1 Tax=Thiocystis minor TaxID=61597 RepID=UPI0019120229|nr:hypothetical protein [Thiocystis minor]
MTAMIAKLGRFLSGLLDYSTGRNPAELAVNGYRLVRREGLAGLRRIYHDILGISYSGLIRRHDTLSADDKSAIRRHNVAVALNANRALDLLYSDEDKIDTHGNRFSHYFKPDWDPDLFLGQNLISHLGVYRRTLAVEIGGFRKGYEGLKTLPNYYLFLLVKAQLIAKAIVPGRLTGLLRLFVFAITPRALVSHPT